MSINDKKKHTAVRELAIGSGIVVLTAPIIITAISGALAAVVIGGVLMFNAEPELRSTFIRMFALNSLIFVTIIWVLWRTLQRTAFLTHRLWGLNRENKRMDTLTNTQDAESRLSLSHADDEFMDDRPDSATRHFQQG